MRRQDELVERLLQENARLVDKLIEEKDTQLRLLAAEIDWLRAQLRTPSLPATIKSNTFPPEHNHLNPPSVDSSDGWETEAAEAEAILAREGLSPAHLAEILDGLGVSEAN
jgi:hypothetical protein